MRGIAAAARTMQASKGDRLVTTLGELEVVNALGLRVSRKEVSATQAQSSLNDFEKDLRDGVFQLRPSLEQVFERARQLSRQTTPKLCTRTADVWHVATALNCLRTTSTASTSGTSGNSKPWRLSEMNFTCSNIRFNGIITCLAGGLLL